MHATYCFERKRLAWAQVQKKNHKTKKKQRQNKIGQPSPPTAAGQPWLYAAAETALSIFEPDKSGESANAVPHYQKLCSRVSRIWGNRRGQHSRSAMAEPRPGRTTFVIMVSRLPGKYELGKARPPALQGYTSTSIRRPFSLANPPTLTPIWTGPRPLHGKRAQRPSAFRETMVRLTTALRRGAKWEKGAQA
uniref:Xenopus laevis tandemly arranged embryonic U1 snRNA genes U1a/U1b n=1 Tax=Xenopus laevis TaxID=8355 RepID=Q91874_XENLA|nr:unnamed protein product [Xenopus laevis]